jgi:hypothetical protein
MTIPKSAVVGRVLMTLCTVGYGFLPPLVDLGGTHVLHPDWTPHSRMHMVWLLATNFGVSVLALYLLWLHGARATTGVRLAGLLGVCVYGGFLLAASTTALYGGALSDRGGVPPVMGMDLNLLVFSLALLILMVGWFLARPRGARNHSEG